MIQTSPQGGLAHLFFLACAVACPATAFAGGQSTGEIMFETADVDSSGTLSKAEFYTTFETINSKQSLKRKFAKADRSGNGSITLLEYLIFLNEEEPLPKEELSFREADLNNSATIDLDEFVAFSPGKTPPATLIKSFRIADDDANGLLSLADWTLLQQGQAKPAQGEKFLKFDLVDLDENDALGPAEFSLVFPRGTSEAKVIAKFNKLDKNDDEVLTRSEYNPGGPKSPL